MSRINSDLSKINYFVSLEFPGLIGRSQDEPAPCDACSFSMTVLGVSG